jgi:DNA-directed RNA polymerase specialized sigma24 family protein
MTGFGHPTFVRSTLLTNYFASNSSGRFISQADAYLHAFHQTALQQLRGRKYSHIQQDDANDIASRMVLRVLMNLDDYRQRYPMPEKLASVMVGQAAIGHFRSEGAQRGDGVRRGRSFGHFDTADTGHGPTPDLVTADEEGGYVAIRRRRQFRAELAESMTEAVTDDLDDCLNASAAAQACRLMHAALIQRGIDERGRWLLNEVDGYGTTVVDAAKELGITRETAQRALHVVRKAARDIAQEWQANGFEQPW